jgi:hypothetical protein
VAGPPPVHHQEWRIRGIQRIETFLSIGELVGATNRSHRIAEPPGPRR